MEKGLKQVKTSDLIWQPDKGKMPVLNQISIELKKGCFYGILGPNGAGKTSFARELLDFLPRTSGQVYLDERAVNEYRRKDIAKNISFLPQNINSDVDFTVYEMVAMGREPYRKALSPLGAEDFKAIEEAMSYTDCLHIKDKSISKISGGERQRVMIARTIAQDTPWIILDEPVSSLDIAHQARLMQLLERLRIEKKKTIVAILHDINLATAYCTHLILMKEGKVYAEGKTEEILTEENLKYLYDIEFEFINVEGRRCPYIVPLRAKPSTNVFCDEL